MSAGHTEGELIFDLHNTYRNGGRTYAYIRRPGDIAPVGGIVLGVEGMPEDRDTGRAMVAAFNSYRRHFGPRAIEAAEADLLGSLIDESQFLIDRLNDFEKAITSETDASEFDGHVKPSVSRLQSILSQAHPTEGAAS